MCKKFDLKSFSKHIQIKNEELNREKKLCKRILEIIDLDKNTDDIIFDILVITARKHIELRGKNPVKVLWEALHQLKTSVDKVAISISCSTIGSSVSIRLTQDCVEKIGEKASVLKIKKIDYPA